MNTQALDFGAVVSKKLTGTRLVLVRHGETDWNREKRFQGHTDIPLNKQGETQALLVQRYLDTLAKTVGFQIDACFSSDLARAHNTARLVSEPFGLQVLLTQGLRERDYGHLSGLTGDEMRLKSPVEFEGLQKRLPDSPLQGGETLRSFYQRVVSCFKDISDASKGKTVLLVAHGGVLDCIYRHCQGEPLEKPRDWLLPNCALNVVEIDLHGNQAITAWAWQGHLNPQDGRQNMDEVDGRIT